MSGLPPPFNQIHMYAQMTDSDFALDYISFSHTNFVSLQGSLESEGNRPCLVGPSFLLFFLRKEEGEEGEKEEKEEEEEEKEEKKEKKEKEKEEEEEKKEEEKEKEEERWPWPWPIDYLV
jgi:hypothetical protein